MVLPAGARIPLLAIVLLSALIAGEMLELSGGATMPAVVEGAPENLATLPQSGRAGLVDTILERPLFVPGRHSAGRPTGQAGGEQVPRLTGIVMTGARRTALFQAMGEKPKVLREGETLGGWTIASITHRQVVLQKSGGTMTIELAPDKSGAPGPEGLASPFGGTGGRVAVPYGTGQPPSPPTGNPAVSPFRAGRP